MSSKIFRKIHKILIVEGDKISLNLVYGEYFNPRQEILGSYSGQGSGGYFYQNEFEQIIVSTDPLDFPLDGSKYSAVFLFNILDQMRSKFEALDKHGNMVGLSKAGQDFLSTGLDLGYDLYESFSEEASDDFIFDLQDQWNLSYRR